MTTYLKTQTKEIQKGTLRIQKVLEKDSKVPYYIGSFQPKNFGISRVVIKRFSRINFKELESRI
jgi:hypothetical protein